jgi:hypothetical protein
MSGHPPMSLSSPTEFDSLFEPLLDSDGAAQLLRIHPKTVQRKARLTPTRANVRCSGKWHNRHWHGVGAARRGCRNDSSDWKFISATLLDRLEARDSLAGNLSQGARRSSGAGWSSCTSAAYREWCDGRTVIHE